MIRRILLALTAVALLALPARAADLSAQDKADVARVEAYLNTIRTAESRFTQFASNGEVSTGDFHLQRPGKLRFEYDPPVPILIVATGSDLIYFEKELEQVSYIPVGRTPLGFLLAPTVAFGKDITVDRVQRQPGALAITGHDTRRPEEGAVTLVFTEQPFELRQWIVRDTQGKSTTISLEGLRTGVTLDPKLFQFVNPNFTRDGIRPN
jgi:outer membrane lipoprotein-sorting protein